MLRHIANSRKGRSLRRARILAASKVRGSVGAIWFSQLGLGSNLELSVKLILIPHDLAVLRDQYDGLAKRRVTLSGSGIIRVVMAALGRDVRDAFHRGGVSRRLHMVPAVKPDAGMRLATKSGQNDQKTRQ